MRTRLETPKEQQYNSHSKNNLVPLLKIPEAKVEIYSDCIVYRGQNLLQPNTADTGVFSTIVDESKFQQNLKEQQKIKNIYSLKLQPQRVKIIQFSNANFAFNIDDNSKIIELHDLEHHTIGLKFKVNSLQTVLTVQSLLRRKMCELGFQHRYKIVKLLGKGASAQVHLVQRISDRKLFAAKIISIKDANDKSYVNFDKTQQTFINQSKLLRILRHRNIVNLESLYIHKKQLIQVMQYLQGGTLLHLVKHDQLQNRKQKWKVLRDLTSALDHLRQRRIVHRDLKMENVLIRKIGDQRQFVLSDFGLSSWTGEKAPIFQRCGTPGYIAPEVLNSPKGKPILNHKTDIFSLGVIAHILFLHQPLFPYNGNIKQLLKLNKKAEYTLQGYIYQDLTLTQIGFLEMALAKDPQKRVSADQLMQQVKYIADPSIELTPQKSWRQKSKQKITMDGKALGVQVQVKKATSLTKSKINLDSSRSQKSDQKEKEKREVSSARKIIDSLWSSLTSPSSKTQKKQTIKLKENSIQKQRKLSEYF